MKKGSLNVNRKMKNIFLFGILLIATTPAFAGGGGGGLDGALGSATTELSAISGTLTTLIYAVGGIVGVIGGLRIFNKWNNGDSDINKEIVGWGGAALFLFLTPSIMTAFFNF
jgi:hypothetical protein